MAYVKPKSHKRQTLNATVAKSREGMGKLDPYSVESLREHMNTGGGQPIPKGHKMTNERRVLQPRDPVTQQFEYNSSADLGLKDRSRGKKIPIAARRMGFNSDMVEKIGNVAMIDGKAWIRNGGDKISEADVIDYFKRFHEDSGEFVNKAGETFTSSWQRKRGRTNMKEKTAIANRRFVVGETVEFDTYFKAVKAQGASVNKGHLAKLDPSSPKYKSNNAWNDVFDDVVNEAKGMGVSEDMIFAGRDGYSEGDERHEEGSIFDEMRGAFKKAYNEGPGGLENAKKAVLDVVKKYAKKDEGPKEEPKKQEEPKRPEEPKKEKPEYKKPSGYENQTWDYKKGYGDDLKEHREYEIKDELGDL